MRVRVHMLPPVPGALLLRADPSASFGTCPSLFLHFFGSCALLTCVGMYFICGPPAEESYLLHHYLRIYFPWAHGKPSSQTLYHTSLIPEGHARLAETGLSRFRFMHDVKVWEEQRLREPQCFNVCSWSDY